MNYSLFLFGLVGCTVLNATYKESLPILIHNADAVQFESTFNQFLADTSVSDQDKQELTTDLLTTVHTLRALLEQEAMLPTDTGRIAHGTAQLVGGTLALFHSICATAPLGLWVTQGLVTQSDCGRWYMLNSNNDLRAHLFPCRQIYKIAQAKGLFVYTIIATIAGLYAGPKLCTDGYKNIAYKQSISQKLDSLTTIEQLILATSPHTQREMI